MELIDEKNTINLLQRVERISSLQTGIEWKSCLQGHIKDPSCLHGIVGERSNLPESLKLSLRKNPCSCINCKSNNEGSCAYTHITGQSCEFDKKSIVASKAQRNSCTMRVLFRSSPTGWGGSAILGFLGESTLGISRRRTPRQFPLLLCNTSGVWCTEK